MKISLTEQAFAALMRNYISGSIAVEDSLDLFNTAINLYCLNFVVLTHCIEEYHGIAIRKTFNVGNGSLVDQNDSASGGLKSFKLIHLISLILV